MDTTRRIYRVPMWLKGAFFWFTFLLCISLLAQQAYRRYTIRQLLVANALSPLGGGNTQAPDFDLLAGAKGERKNLKAFEGKWVLMNFWATWCPPCREEMPSLEALHKHFDNTMSVVAISVDEDWNDVDKFFAKRNPNLVLLWDRGQHVAQTYLVERFPETFLISPEGKIVARFSGPRDWFSKESLAYFDGIMKKT